jgi:hypothetical protein
MGGHGRACEGEVGLEGAEVNGIRDETRHDLRHYDLSFL